MADKKSSENFEKVIQEELTKRAYEDPNFGQRFVLPTKNIKDCCNYIMNTVQKSGVNGFTDEEVFGMAMHYYLEDEVDPGKSIDCQVIVNRQIELTPEEIEEAKQKAKDVIIQEAKAKAFAKPKPVVTEVKKEEKQEQGSLF